MFKSSPAWKDKKHRLKNFFLLFRYSIWFRFRDNIFPLCILVFLLVLFHFLWKENIQSIQKPKFFWDAISNVLLILVPIVALINYRKKYPAFIVDTVGINDQRSEKKKAYIYVFIRNISKGLYAPNEYTLSVRSDKKASHLDTGVFQETADILTESWTYYYLPKARMELPSDAQILFDQTLQFPLDTNLRVTLNCDGRTIRKELKPKS